ncbi:MAG: trehalose-phosphatase [Candidatus Omnitrophota bacterium]
MKNYHFDAAIFDLDGVITKTALVHVQAWKEVFDEYLRLREKRDNEPFREFTHGVDYLKYVDGKPRYDGVISFFESRGIKIPYGNPDDALDQETVCGIGNKKNFKFLEIMKREGAEVYSSTIDFIKELKKAGIAIGIISSSKNCKYILHSVGIEHLFQTRVDGEVSVQLGIRGKPEADIFVVAAHNLKTIPSRSVVVEDAISGVQAGRSGGFGLVIGLARKDNEDALIENGADVAMPDISAINLEWVKQWFLKKPQALFQFWNKEPDISGQLGAGKGKIVINPSYSHSGASVFFGKKKTVFFLDYDGTLTPIVDRPELAVMSKEMKDVVLRLSKKFTVAIVSGRMREDVEGMVGIKGLLYAGSHGFDISAGAISLIEPRAEATIKLVTEAIKQLKAGLNGIPGVLIEEKKFSVAVHYRLVDEKHLSRIKALVDSVIQDNHSLRLMQGKKVFEILPAIDWDKGKAIKWIMQALKISWSDTSVVYIGDDITDEDAFRAVRTMGTGILVTSEPKESAADFWLSSPAEVGELFKRILGR